MTDPATRAETKADTPAGRSRRALVLFSGGQDSTVCLASALSRFETVETIGFDYGQRHSIELTQRQIILSKFAAASSSADFDFGGRLGKDHVLDLTTLGQISDTALTRDSAITIAASGLPSTFVPARNLVFLTYAAAVAYRRDIDLLVGGMCETDFSGYPDCRRATIDATEQSLSLGLDRPLRIETPLMELDKQATWALAHALGGDALIALIVNDTHTCYLGVRDQRHAWGFGCGDCPACQLRANGYHAWRAAQV